MTVYLVHGLLLRSDIPLSAPEVDEATDLVVRTGASAPVGSEAPPGELVASVCQDGVAYTVTREGDDLWFRLHGTADLRIQGGAHISVHMDPKVEPGLVSVLLTGAVPALIHTAAGTCVIHASTVAFEDGAVGFVGGSGAGKSTLSALCCAAGARVVSEDLLRVRFDSGGPVALAGVPEIRLRPGAAGLAQSFPAELVGTTADGRTTIRFPTWGDARLAALLLPAPARDALDVEPRRLSPGDAVIELARYPRILGWRTPEVRAARFETLAALARSIPVLRVRVPWGPPFDPGLVDELRRAAGLGGP